MHIAVGLASSLDSAFTKQIVKVLKNNEKFSLWVYSCGGCLWIWVSGKSCKNQVLTKSVVQQIFCDFNSVFMSSTVLVKSSSKLDMGGDIFSLRSEWVELMFIELSLILDSKSSSLATMSKPLILLVDKTSKMSTTFLLGTGLRQGTGHASLYWVNRALGSLYSPISSAYRLPSNSLSVSTTEVYINID